ncbi:MAG: FxsA family protein [Chloroflexota bacterium]|nr:FxsA family protein [Chloroflexota bacterium]
MRIVALFVIVPLIELALLIYIGTLIGPLYTMTIVVITGLAGGIMARRQGISTLNKIRYNLESGIIPSKELFDGLLILAGGLLLLTPGVFTDIIGFTLMIPHSRRFIGRKLLEVIKSKLERGEIVYWKLH